MATNPYADIMANLNNTLGNSNSKGIMNKIEGQNTTNYDWIGAAPKAVAPISPAPVAPSDHWGWNGFLDNPIGKASGAFYLADLLGKGYKTVEDKTGLTNVNGFVKNALTQPPSQPLDHGNGSYLDAYAGMGRSILSSLNDLIHNGVEGFKNPNKAEASYGKGMEQVGTMFHDPISKFMFNMEAGMGTDAATFLPFGAASDAIKAAKYGKPAVATPETVKAFGGQYGLKGSGSLPTAAEAIPGATSGAATLDDAIANAMKQETPAAAAASGKYKISSNPMDYINRAMTESKSAVSQKITPPYENPKELASYVHDAVGGKLSDVRALPYEDLRQLAEEHYQTLKQGDPFYDISKSVAAKQGYHLDDLFAGKTPNIMGRVAQDAQKRVAGIYDAPKMNFTKPEFLKPADAHNIPDISANPDAMAAFGTHKANMVSSMLESMGFGSGLNTLSTEVRNAALNGLAERASGGHILDKFGAETAANAANSGHDIMSLNDLAHTYETTGAGHEAINPLVNLLKNGLEGTNAGLAKITEHGIAPSTLKENYMPITLGKQGLMEKMSNIIKGKESKMPVDNAPSGMQTTRNITGETYNMDRQFQTMKQARAAGYNVDNPITAAVKTAKNHHNDVTNIKTLNSIKEAGIKSGEVSKAPAAGLKHFTSKDTTNPLNNMYLSKGLHNFVTTEYVNRPWSRSNISVISPALKGYDKLMNLVRNVTLYTPGVHNHNIFGNSMLGFGLDTQAWANAEKAMAGKGSEALNTSKAWAEKTGALHNDMHGNIESQIKRVLAGKNAKGAYGRFQDKTLWDRERALRLGVFHDAFQEGLKRGLSEPQAANIARDVTNKNMVDYSKNNLSTFEREVMSRLDPYYKWHKGNYPLQFARLADPAALGRMIKTKDAEDKIQQEINGKHIEENIGGPKEKQYKWQLPLDKQNSISFDPYLPQDEIHKMLDESPANFAYNRLASPIRELIGQATNSKYYPSTTFAPDDKQYLAGSSHPIANPSDSAGKQMLDRLTHAIGGTLLPPDQPISTGTQALQELAGKAPDSNLPTVPPLDKLLLSLSGGFPASTPMSENKVEAQKYLENNFMAKNALNAWKADHPGERVPPALQKSIAHQYGLKTIK